MPNLTFLGKPGATPVLRQGPSQRGQDRLHVSPVWIQEIEVTGTRHDDRAEAVTKSCRVHWIYEIVGVSMDH